MRDNIRGKDWEDIDPWWNVFGQMQQEDLIELYELMKELSDRWDQNNSRFDEDPLVVDWSENSNETGPLSTGQEENWSDWLAHLIRSSEGYFVKELFGKKFDSNPKSVRREKYFQGNEEDDRRADILVYYENKGISIEVKLDDEHYQKTAHTAYLIEQRDNREWTHYLLLPKYKEGFLKNTFGSKIKCNNYSRLTILSQRYSEVEVIFWKDVSKALRKTLLDGEGLDPHWEAGAYIFITLIEQKIFRIHPISFVQRNVVEGKIPSFSDVERLETIDVEDQIGYLSSIIEVENNE